MKIEICEHLIQSWLKHIKNCQIVQTNWTLSPFLADEISQTCYEEVNFFIDLIKSDENFKDFNIFKQSTTKQMLLQCEIDTVGIAIKNQAVEKIYMVDSAFHESGLNYGDTVARIIKKLIRAVFIARIVYPKIPCELLFVTPKCGYELQDNLKKMVSLVKKTVQDFFPEINIEFYANESFAKEIYAPILENIQKISDDNDLFLRSLQLAKIADGYLKNRTHYPPIIPPIIDYEPISIDGQDTNKPTGIPTGFTYTNLDAKQRTNETKTPRGGNTEIVFNILQGLIRNGKILGVLPNLLNKAYCSRVFSLPYPMLIPVSNFKEFGYERIRFYSELIEIDGKDYLVCSQWTKEVRIPRLQKWYSSISL